MNREMLDDLFFRLHPSTELSIRDRKLALVATIDGRERVSPIISLGYGDCMAGTDLGEKFRMAARVLGALIVSEKTGIQSPPDQSPQPPSGNPSGSPDESRIDPGSPPSGSEIDPATNAPAGPLPTPDDEIPQPDAPSPHEFPDHFAHDDDEAMDPPADHPSETGNDHAPQPRQQKNRAKPKPKGAGGHGHG